MHFMSFETDLSKIIYSSDLGNLYNKMIYPKAEMLLKAYRGNDTKTQYFLLNKI